MPPTRPAPIIAAMPAAPASARDLALDGPEATDALGARLAPHLRAGDAVLLEGPLGAGKSHLARAVIRARTRPEEEVPSPTYTLVQTYEARDGTAIWHADLYRLSGPEEVEELGLLDALGEAVCLIEWPDRLGPLAPRDALTLTLTPRGDGRLLAARADASRWVDLEAILGG